MKKNKDLSWVNTTTRIVPYQLSLRKKDPPFRSCSTGRRDTGTGLWFQQSYWRIQNGSLIYDDLFIGLENINDRFLKVSQLPIYRRVITDLYSVHRATMGSTYVSSELYIGTYKLPRHQYYSTLLVTNYVIERFYYSKEVIALEK